MIQGDHSAPERGRDRWMDGIVIGWYRLRK
jgi:hypothetical protein